MELAVTTVRMEEFAGNENCFSDLFGQPKFYLNKQEGVFPTVMMKLTEKWLIFAAIKRKWKIPKPTKNALCDRLRVKLANLFKTAL